VLEGSLALRVELVDVHKLGVGGKEGVQLLEGASLHGREEPGLQRRVVVAPVSRLGERLGGREGLVGGQGLKTLLVDVAVSGVVSQRGVLLLLWGRRAGYRATVAGHTLRGGHGRHGASRGEGGWGGVLGVARVRGVGRVGGRHCCTSFCKISGEFFTNTC